MINFNEAEINYFKAFFKEYKESECIRECLKDMRINADYVRKMEENINQINEDVNKIFVDYIKNILGCYFVIKGLDVLEDLLEDEMITEVEAGICKKVFKEW
ncbi:hypothetical protein IAI10_20295 [Clostridium sp. 19966]|uniref:hypothetical protein n=1 Tax=Clostridium sp. 19966 TaxID=2768166 RepID=UPI0028DFB113|nr:hypothetical protein [Clostridium sp. 19966]MDT8718998.1 hypothetical protein [Clostridium sp. 19966]